VQAHDVGMVGWASPDCREWDVTDKCVLSVLPSGAGYCHSVFFILTLCIIPFCLYFPSLSSFKTHTIIRSHSHNLSWAHQCQSHPGKRVNEVLKTSENSEMKFIDYSSDPLFVVLRKLWSTKVTDWWKWTQSTRKR